MADYPLVVDLSSNDLGETDFPCLKAAGVVAAVYGVFSGNGSPHAMAAFADEGLRAGIPVLSWYGLPYFGDVYGEERDLRWCVEVAKYYPPLNNTIWMDCEEDANKVGWNNAPTPSQDERIAALWRVKRDIIEIAGYRAGVYAGTYWWRDNMGNTAAFADCPWWLPAYGKDGYPRAPITPEDWAIMPGALAFHPELAAHQFTSMWGAATGHPCGRANRDMSYWYEPFAGGDEMDPRVDEILKALTGQTDAGVQAKRLADWNANGNSLLDGYAAEQAKLAEHLNEHDQVAASGVGPHQHVPGDVA